MPVDKCKLPAYVPHDPLTWFRAVEACFHIHSIKREADKAALVVAALPAKQLQQVSALLSATCSDQYAALKRNLIAKDAPSFQDNWERCVALPPLRPGDRPSDMYTTLTSWLTDNQDSDNPWVRATFISKMPDDLKMMLLAYPNCNLEQLATFADTLSASLSGKRRTSPPVFSMGVDPEMGDDSPPPVLAVRSPRQASQQAPRQSNQPPPARGQDLCWFHRTFGDRARSCKQGCPHAGSVNSSQPGQ